MFACHTEPYRELLPHIGYSLDFRRKHLWSLHVPEQHAGQRFGLDVASDQAVLMLLDARQHFSFKIHAVVNLLVSTGERSSNIFQ